MLREYRFNLSEHTQQKLVYEFHEVLAGNLKKIDPAFFKNKTPEVQERMALFLILYLIEVILEWTPIQARACLDVRTLKEWNLDIIAKKVRSPPELDFYDDTYYIVKKIYPNEIHLSARDVYLKTYRRVLEDEKKWKFPKGYFTDISGKSKACLFLRYAIENNLSFTCVEDMYHFFGTKQCIQFLKDYKLDIPRRTLFTTPVEFFDCILPPEQRNPLMFLYYHLWSLSEEKERAENEKRGRRPHKQPPALSN